MSLQRRRHLLELAYRHHVPILEDDPYSELRFEGESLPSLKALDDRDYVLYLSTFSKTLFPGMRLGYMVGPRTPISQFALMKQGIDLHSNGPGQWILDRYIREGHYDTHLGFLRDEYRIRRDTMQQALDTHAPDSLRWNKPVGGFYFWLNLSERVDRSRLVAMANETGVSFLPGWSCFAEDPDELFIRLNFSYPSQHHISAGVERLMTALKGVKSQADNEKSNLTGTPPLV